jgi:hypothetical protein
MRGEGGYKALHACHVQGTIISSCNWNENKKDETKHCSQGRFYVVCQYHYFYRIEYFLFGKFNDVLLLLL